MYGTIVEYIKNFKDEDHTYDLEDEYYGLCKILPDGAIAIDNNYTYLDLWTPLTCFEATTQVDVDDEYVLLYGVDWLFANDNNHVLEKQNRGKIKDIQVMRVRIYMLVRIYIYVSIIL